MAAAAAQPKKGKRIWYEGRSSKDSPEAFSPGVHCTFAELEQDRTSVPRRLPKDALRSKDDRFKSRLDYKCVTDAEHLNVELPYNHEFEVKHLRHVTTKKNAAEICKTKGFQGKKNENDGRCQEAEYCNKEYVWWSVYFEKNPGPRADAHEIAGKVGYAKKKISDDKKWTCPFFVEPSYPFQDQNFNYGTKAFCYTWEEIINAYKKQFSPKSELHFRILGTYVYHQEIMHAIVVHSSENEGDFKKMPLIEKDFEGNRVRRYDEGLKMTWCPESAIRINKDPYSPWEHLSFAFYVPNNKKDKKDKKDKIFQLPKLGEHLYDIKCVFPPPGDQVNEVEDSKQSASSIHDVVRGLSNVGLNK